MLARTLYGWGYTPVLLGTAAESAIAESICKATPQTLNLTGKTALTDIALLARKAAAAIGNDTGPMHLIAPTGCPSYVLFSGHTNPERHAPLGARVSTLQKGELKDLSPEDVISHLNVRDFQTGP